MNSTDHPDRSRIDALQARKLEALTREVLTHNTFYRSRLEPLGFTADRPPALEDLARLPVTTKGELVEDQRGHPPFGTNLTYPVSRYTRLHQTSGTTGEPLRWLDTPESWKWWLDCWEEIYTAPAAKPRSLASARRHWSMARR